MNKNPIGVFMLMVLFGAFWIGFLLVKWTVKGVIKLVQMFMDNRRYGWQPYRF